MTLITTTGERFEVEDVVAYRNSGEFWQTADNTLLYIDPEDVHALEFHSKGEAMEFLDEGNAAPHYDEWIEEA